MCSLKRKTVPALSSLSAPADGTLGSFVFVSEERYQDVGPFSATPATIINMKTSNQIDPTAAEFKYK